MLTYSLIAYLIVGGAVRTDPIDQGLTLTECETMIATLDKPTVLGWLSTPTDADIVPLSCVAEGEAV